MNIAGFARRTQPPPVASDASARDHNRPLITFSSKLGDMLARKRRTANNSNAVSFPQLPTEVWISVFSYVHGLRDLRALCQTCKTFLPLVQPALFRSIRIVSPSLRIPPGTGKVKKRLKILARPHIAPNIQALRILSEYPHYPDHNVLDAIWTLISLAQNLTSLHIFDMEMSAARMSGICALPRLKELYLLQCRDTSHPTGTTYISDRLSSLRSFQCNPEPPWLTFFDPKTVECLILSSQTTTSLPDSWTFEEPFPCLKYLRASHWFIAHPLFTEIINSAPALRELVITSGKGPWRLLSHIQPEILSKLEVYEGPEYCAPMFVQGGKLIRVTLWEYPFFTQDNNAGSLDDALEHLALQCETLEYLTLRLSVLPEDVFASTSRFVNLKTLHVFVKVVPPDRTRPELVNQLLQANMPKPLQSISFSCDMRSDHDSDAIDESMNTLARLSEIHPQLVRAHFIGRDFNWKNFD